MIKISLDKIIDLLFLKIRFSLNEELSSLFCSSVILNPSPDIRIIWRT